MTPHDRCFLNFGESTALPLTLQWYRPAEADPRTASPPRASFAWKLFRTDAAVCDTMGGDCRK